MSEILAYNGLIRLLENKMETSLKEKRIRKFFKITISLKGVYSFLEIIGGILLLVIPPATLTQAVVWSTYSELAEDPHDLIANALLHFGNQLSLSTTIFGGLYLLINGLIKTFLVWALLKNKLWAFPLSLGVLGLFILYQIYRLTFAYSIGFVALTVFDFVVIWFIWKEYQIVRE